MCQQSENRTPNVACDATSAPTVEHGYHLPVLLHEAVEGLAVRSDSIIVDATFGGGGHSRAIVEQLGPEGHLYAFDQDAEAVANALDDSRFTLINENFRHLRSFLRLHGVRHIDGLLADLGVSSHQFDEAQRGFSIRFDGPLDLRMDQRSEMTASDLVNQCDEAELCRLLTLYGELPNARAMAHAIVTARAAEPITTTFALRDAVAHHLPRGHENKYLAMLFQALRIEVNGELEALRQMLEQATALLTPGGRLCIITYHSLEDRLVKNYFRAGNFEGEIEKDFYGNALTTLRPVTRKPITPSNEELRRNNRSRSAKLRIAEKKEEPEKEA
ncbi:MAG: 16S rRNA (cytosine(1402)-N(4))-methyltransferase RsmH [Bacteroidales bacterium]|nr:16S rRNA (cytosine(1402)-N(4))-methyltransferase RsmH [Bacteroidales bacterium]